MNSWYEVDNHAIAATSDLMYALRKSLEKQVAADLILLANHVSRPVSLSVYHQIL